jgi:UDP-glucose 4-epimerase
MTRLGPISRRKLVNRLKQLGSKALMLAAIPSSCCASPPAIASEICRQVAICEPEILVMLDRTESALFQIDAEFSAKFPKVKRSIVLADIKHLQPMQQTFSRDRPEIVFDAAAYKHVPMMEMHPGEAVLNNIVGTRRLAEVARSPSWSSWPSPATDPT